MTRSQSLLRTATRPLAARSAATLLRALLPGVLFGALALGGLAGCGGPEYPNCNTDEDCHENEFCVNGQCQQCRPDGNDCPAGQRCAGGRCEDIPGWCESNADCPGDQECRDNQCVAPVISQPQDMEPQPTQCSLSTVYFAYDSSELDGSTRSTLESNASCIQERDIPSVTLTGHADPRGTEEYNLALGERRAQSVQSYLQRLGVPRGNMTTRSMGEEMARGHDESTWRQDRRVEVEAR